MEDQILDLLQKAKNELLLGQKTRESSVAMTHVDTAILWREEDLRVKSGIER